MILFRQPVARAQLGWVRFSRFHWGRIPTQREMERAVFIVGLSWIAMGVIAVVGPLIWP